MGIKISNLPTATESQTTDIVPIVQDGTTKKIQQSILFKNLNDGMADLNNEMTDLDSRLEEAIAEFSTPLKYKGQVQTFNDLPVNADNGDIYSVVSENKNYVWNGTEWIEYSQTINIDDEIKTTLTTQEASETEITNIAGVNGKIDVTSGNTEQATSLSDGILEQGSISNTGEEVESTARNRTKNFIGVKVGTQIVVSTNDNFQYMPIWYNSSKTFISISGSWINTGTGVTIPSNVAYIKIILKKSDNSDFTPSSVTNFNVGTTPSPDYPSEIHNVGDNVNLANPSVLENGALNGSDGLPQESAVTNQRVRTSNTVSFKAGTYTISEPNLQLVVYRFNGSRVVYNADLNQAWKTPPYTFTLNTDGYITYAFKKTDESDLLVSEVQCKIEKGTQATPYSPYNCGNTNIEVQNKNLFNKNGEIITGYYLNASGQPVSAGGAWYTNYYIPVKSNTAYTSSGGDVANRVCFYDENKNFISRTNQEATTFTYTTPANCKYIRISNNNDYSNVQVEKGSTATSYVPHQSQLITFPFTEGQRLYKGDYLASDGIHHKKKQVVFDGTENWQLLDTSSAKFSLNISDLKRDNSEVCAKSNYFEGLSYSSSWSSYDYFIVSNSTSITEPAIRINHKDISSLADFKTYLATQYSNGNPVIIEYELENEIIEPFTPEQEEAYWQLQHALMYEGYTKIECIDEIKCKFKVEYSYNNELNTTYQGKIDEINEDIHNLDNKVDENINRIENEINTLHSYSTSEQVVGTWVDGKPIYRRCFSDTINSSDTYLDSRANNYKRIINSGGSIYQINGEYCLKAGETSATAGANAFSRFYIASNYLGLQVGSDFLGGTWGYEVYVEYTKTTD